MVLCFLSYAHAVQSCGVHDSHTQSDGWWPLHNLYRDFHWNHRSGGEYKPAHTCRHLNLSVQTLSFFPMSIFCRISWWSHSCFSRTWLGNMCIPLTGWPWSWYRTGTKPSAVCCPDLNLGLFSASVGLHINSCIHTTPSQGFGRDRKAGIKAAMSKMTDVENVTVWGSWWCERCRFFDCVVSWGLLLCQRKRQVDRVSESWGWQEESQRWKGKKEKKSRRWGRGHGSLVWIMMTDSCGTRRLGSDRVLNFQKA